MKSESIINFDVSVGRDELSNNFVLNIPKLAHLLVAGVAGSGKSNLLHSIISNLSSGISPSDLKFILIDSKRVELNVYNQLPHLLTPVITDAKKTVLALKWAGKEMDRRLEILKSENVRDIESYRSMDHKEESMPYILIVMDGLSDMLATYPVEVEAAITRLTQMSHKVGIHLVLSTSRTANKVITEPIKSGMTSRMAFKLPSVNDSINIIGAESAEKLEVPAEVLFQSGSMKFPVCVRLSMVSDEEIRQKLKGVKDTYKEIVPSVFATNPDDYDSDDDLYEEAREAVIAAGKASTSYIQRKLGVGYSRAAQLMDLLENKGVIGPAEGSSPRKVLS